MAEAYLDTLQPLKFGGITMPYQRITVRGVQRDHVHEYPHVHGGAAEKLGRKLYEISVSSKFDERIGRGGGRFANRNLLTDLGVLQQYFENGDTQDLYIPNIGEIRAYCTNWTRELSVQWRSGESVELTFREDQESDFLTLTTLQFQVGVMSVQLGDFESLSPDPMPSVFQQIREGVNAILAFRDTAQMWAGFLAEKIEGMRALFQEADETLDLLNDPENWELLEAMKRLWESVNDFAETALGIDQFKTYTTPSEMTADEVSSAIYDGDSSYAIDILNLNAIGDAYHIPAGTDIKYIPAA
jgi:hypothetical protein